MTRKIYKVTVAINEQFTLLGKAIHLDEQNGVLCVWYEHQDDVSDITDNIVLGTGWAIPENAKHVSTVVTNGFVWHLYRI